MSKVVIMLGFFCILGVVPFFDQASAVCCFPYNMNHYVDPITGNLVLNGELQNDSYRREPFGNTGYRFVFSDKDNNEILERSILLTERLPVEGGAAIPFLATFPFQIVLEDVDQTIIPQISSFHMDGTETLDYFFWKPADLIVSSSKPVNIGTISGKNGDVFNKWQISGNITNTNSQKTQNVYVVASLRNENDNVIGVAGYSDDSIQPVTLDGFETKTFVISALVHASVTPVSVIMYAESDESSMVYQYYKPVIMKNIIDREGKISSDPKKPILISANITNISRNDLDFEWIIQITKSPKSISEGDISEYPESKVAFLGTIPSHIGAQKSTILKYQWVPQSNGIYFYEMYVWDDSRATALSFPFVNSFLDDNWMIVSSNLNSVTNQIKSGVPLDDIQCREGMQLAHKASNGNLVCIKSENIPKLIERGWATHTKFSANSSGVLAQDPKCDIMDQLTMEVFHCPAISAPTKMDVLQVEGFDTCKKDNEDISYVLKPGETGKITYVVYRGMDMNNPPFEPEYKEILTEPSFLHEFNTEQGRSRAPFTPDGIHVSYESDLSKLGFNQTATVTVTVSVDLNATEQVMWLGLPPFTCHGGAYVKFAIIGE